MRLVIPSFFGLKAEPHFQHKLAVRCRRNVRTACFTCYIVAMFICATVELASAAVTTEHDSSSTVIQFYDDAIADGYANYSWTSVNFASSERVRRGARAIAIDYVAWGGLYIARETSVPLPYSGALRFSLFSSDAGDFSVVLDGATDGYGVVVTPLPGEWLDVVIPLSKFGESQSVSGIWIQDFTGTQRQRVFIDDVRIVSDGIRPQPEEGVRVSIASGKATLSRDVFDPSKGQTDTHTVSFPHPISEDIYGINFAPNLLREEIGVPVSRWGGNATERYNFQTSSSNQGLDWYFANNAWSRDAHHQFERENQTDGTSSLLTIPSMGWVSSNRRGTCSYPLEVYADQDDSIVHWLSPYSVCGNGRLNGDQLGMADPSVTSAAVDETFATQWVEQMVAQHGTADEGGVEMYAIGNEPGLWHYTHGDLQATPITRQQLIDRDIRYAKAIKAGDSTADVLGPVLWGGSSYYVSSDELLSGIRPVDVPLFLEDYLIALKQAATTHGNRLLDRLAVNFYDERVYGGGSDRLRLQSTRQLWDPNYAPEDWWVVRDFLYANGTALIPRLKLLVEEHYPETPLALTEYNFGDVDGVSGALAQIDALGIFGRESLDMALLWEPYADYVTTPESEFSDRPIFWAFRMYRNYDAAGSRFGSSALLTTSTDETKVSAYSASRADGATTVMLLNKTLNVQHIELDGISGLAEVYRYDSADLRAIVRHEDVEIRSEHYALPARSATLLVFNAPSIQ